MSRTCPSRDNYATVYSAALHSSVTAAQLLSGSVDPPNWANGLITTITTLATGNVALPGGGWGLDSPMNTPTPGEDIDGDEEGYFSRARVEREKQRRTEAERDEHGLTPREYSERGYSFANSYAAGGSMGNKIASPEKEKSQIRSMLSGVGRNRSGSGSSKKSSKSATVASEDPFAGSIDDLPIKAPVSTGYANFETQFSSDFDVDSESRPTRPFSGTGSGTMSRNVSSTGVRSPSPGDSRSRGRDELMSFGDDKARNASASPSGSRNRSRAGSSASTGSGWFKRGSKTKVPTVSSGLRERAEQMKWGSDREGSTVLGSSRDNRDSFDSLDDEDAYGGRARFDDIGSRDQGRFRSSTIGASSGAGTVSAFDRAALSNQTRSRSSSSPLKPRGDDGKSPFDSNTSLSSTDGGAVPSRSDRNAYSAKPWDSEDDLFTSPPQLSHSARGSGASSPATITNGQRARSGTGASSASATNALDLRQVEADFAGVMQLSKHGGSGEVGSHSGSRSRSGTTGGGIGSAIALYDFPGVEVSRFSLRHRLCADA